MQIGAAVAAALAIAIVWAGIAGVSAQTLRAASGAKPIRVGHDNVAVDPALRRFTGMVTALGAPDDEGRIYSFQLKPVGPGVMSPASNEMRGWRLTILAGKRFASVFEVKGNTASEVTVVPRDGPLNGLAVSDVFIIEGYPSAPQPADAAAPQSNS